MKDCPTGCCSCSSFHRSVFSSLNADHLPLLDGNVTHKSYKKGQVIFYQGNEPHGLYCIHTGKVKLYRQGMTDRNTIVRISGPGDLVGYRALLTGDEYTASAEVIEDTELCFIEKRVIDRLMAENPNLTFMLLRKLGRDLRASEDRFQRQTESQLRERIAELLILLKDQYGTTQEGSKQVINIKLSRREIADMLGTTIESVIRQISTLKKEGILEDINHSICIHNEQKLEHIARLDV